MSESERPPLAVVGMSCRYPGDVRSPEDLWKIAVSGREVLSAFPGDRGWNLGELHDDDPTRPGTTYVDRGGFLDDAGGFDSDFFGISPREATSMDPQQRLLLEVAWEAVERSGLDPLSLRGSRTGVFIGGEPREYGPRLSEAPAGLEAHLLTGTTTSVMSGRIAYCLGLRGPALTVDTSASSSLVAMHLAAQALHRDECSLALAGGVSVMSAPGNFLAFSRLRGLARDGRVKAFSADADGTVWAEGVGLLVLERLPDALRNGHRVLALVRGTAMNNDGASDGLTAPNGLAQEAVIRQALADAGLTAEDIDAVEAHGTGTPLGDRTEARALAAAYGLGRRPERPLLLGSLKSNIGHAQAAAGVGGVIKTVMALQHGVLPATLNVTEPNPHVDWSTSGLQLLTEAQPWPESGRVRRAAVSSFGISGTNAHAVLEQAPSVDPEVVGSVTDGPTAWLVSARSATALSGQAERLAEFLAAAPDVPHPSDIAWSLATTRTAFDHRAVIVGTSSEQLTAGLDALAAGLPSATVTSGVADLADKAVRRVVFIFPGQGSQWIGMGRDLAAASPVFAARLAECERALAPHVDWNLRDVLAGAEGAPGLDRDDVIQPVLFAVMVSLAAVWQAAGVTPDAVVGHSQGEFAAACVAGILSLEDAAKASALRSKLLRTLAGRGGMLSIAESVDAVAARLAPYQDRAEIGVVNSPDATVITGDLDVLAMIAADCDRDGVRTKSVPVDYASHSRQIEDLRDELLTALRGITPRPGTIAMVSTATGEFLDGTTADAEYWYANLRQPVQFAQAVETLDRADYDAYIEISPHPVLTGAVSATLEQDRRVVDTDSALLRPAPLVTGTLRRDVGGLDRMLSSLAEAHVRGVQVDWSTVLPSAQQLDLPTYAFEHRRFWLNAAMSGPGSVPASLPSDQTPASGIGGVLRDRITGRPAGEQLRILLELVQAHAAAVLGQPTPEAIQPSRTFKESGFDSMAGVELRTRLNTATGLQLPTTLIFDCPTPFALTGFLRTQLLGMPVAAPLAVRSAAASTDEPIAIVAMSCRLPGGVDNPESLWELLASGADAIGDAPTDRGWDFDELAATASRGGYLPDAGDFDPAFFGISPREALAMDPQQRLLLEISWEAVERLGIDAETLRGSSTGVFIGAAASGYGTDGPRELEGHLRTGSATSVLSGRVAYTFGFEGPAVTVDTACSSSLVALHLAAQALRSGECGLALAGGVTVHADASWLTWFTRQQGLASDGRCKAFSASADGMGMSEGAGVVLLERLSDARRNGHRVLAVVRGTAVNQDGASNGLTAPNGAAQQRVIRSALAGAGLGPQDVDAVEAHGTGTMLGDPIEAQALLATYGQDRDPDRPLWLGTVKSNIGHTQWAAGAAGIIKMVLALQHAQLPRTLHTDLPSPHVDWSSGALALLTEPEDWPDPGRPRRAGVSAFGISGTNAHVILEQAPETPEAPDEVGARSLPVVPWLISARDESGLAAQADRLREFALDRPELDPVDVGWSLASTRSALPRRAVVVGADRDELLAGLNDVTGSAGTVGQVGFVFTGQGAQRLGMGRGLYAAYPVFAEAFDAVCAGLDEHLTHSVSAVIDGAESLDDTVWAQAGLFAIEVALFRLLESWGVAPDVVAGHSIGELAAAHVAGVWSLPDACAVVAARGRLMQALPTGGAMLAVAAAEDDVRAALSEHEGVGIAAVNGPSAVVVSGPADAVSAVRERFEAEGVRVRNLRVSHAFHSSLMEPMLAAFATVTASVSYSAPRIPIVSTLTGRKVTDELLDPGYWVRQVREPVRFADAVTTLRESGVRTFIELGPDAILTALGATTDDATDEAWLPTLRRDRDEPLTLVSALGHLHTRGGTVDWTSFYSGTGAKRVDLPTYAFTRQRYWLTSSATGGRPRDIGLTASGHPLLGTVVELPATGGMVLAGRLSQSAQPWLADHIVAGRIVVPGAALVEMASRAGDEVGCARLAELVIQAPMVLADRRGIHVRITVGEPDERGDRDLAVHSRPEDGSGPWTEHATGILAPAADVPEPADVAAAAELLTWPPADSVTEDLTDLYPALARTGLPYGPAFRGVRRAWRRGEDLFVEIGLAEDADVAGFGLHPVLLDVALHLLAYPDDDGSESGPLLPFAWTDAVIHATGASTARVRLAPSTTGEGVSLILADESGRLIAGVRSLVLRPLPATQTDSIADEALYELNWVPDETTDAADVPEYVLYRPRIVSEHSSNLAELARETTLAALSTVREFLLDDAQSASRLLVVTERAVDAGSVDIDVTTAGVWGLVRVAQAEHPDRIVLVDLDTDLDDAATTELLTRAMSSGAPQIAVRSGRLLVPRLARVSPGLPLPGVDSWRLECTERGTLDNLVLAASESGHRQLEAHEVRVALRAAGVNFRDVLNVLGMYPGDPGPLGLEGAGVVLEVGSDVAGLRPGDLVMGLFPGAFSPSVITDARLLAPVPAGWTLVEAAAAPVVYLTAWHALVELAELRAGESVLIHAAAGGVGSAAVQVAQYLGAEIFGTASPSKWAQLREAGLDDARHLASSRTLDFETHFRGATDGAGIDVVLDSLSGDFVDASLRLAAGAGGRFVEIGKADIRDAAEVARDHDGLAYQAFDLLELDPEQIVRMFADLSDLFARHVLRPLPVVCWDIRRAPEAFRYLSQARNVGKLVLTMPAPAVRRSGTTLVTGASGALGGLIARHLAAELDQQSLVLLLSRRGPQAPGTATLAADLAILGTTVRLIAADVADPGHLAAVIEAIPAEAPLRAVVHAAGLLDDGVIDAGLTSDRVNAVLRPKVDGAWNLHSLTRHLDLDRFVLFSSVSGLWGNPGQAGYAAANTFLDALAGYRVRLGLPATSLAWGPWQDGGMASGLTEAEWQRMARQGLAPLAAADGLGLFDAVATLGQALLVPARLELRSGASHHALLSGLMAPLIAPARTRRAVGSPSSDARGGLAERLAALSASDRDEAVRDVVRAQTALVLGMSGLEAVEATRSFKDLGIDSLTAVELRNRLNAATALRLPAGVVFDYPTPTLLADFLGTTLPGTMPTTKPTTPDRPRAQAVDDDQFVIVGIGCRFPGGIGSPDTFWDLVSSGSDALTPFPKDRGPLWDDVFLEHDSAIEQSHARLGAFLDSAGDFDGSFFGISPREALAMDPQQRLLLETSWEALEDAGIDPASLHGSATGVFAGLIYHDYASGAALPDEVQGYLSTGGSGGVASGRVSYALGLEGPAVTVDTACSSSLVALHLAVQALRSGECSLALAGGVTVMATPGTFLEFARQRGLSADGRCKAYAAGADGTGWGEGVGVLVVERLSDARRNGHRVLAVVRGTAVNQDGASNGLTAPNGPSQQRVIRAALDAAGLQPGDVDVVEGHGTGTRLGDPIEAEALIATYGQGRDADRPVLLGSVKSNIGHTQAAAGVAGVIKMVQAMSRGVVPATLHVDEPSSHVDWASGAVELVTEATAWPQTNRPRRAGVSSFGFSGTNAHVILEQAPEIPEVQVEARPLPVVPWLISARDEVALAAQTQRLREFVLARPDLDPVDVGWSLAFSRSALPQRAVVVGADRGELLAGLNEVTVSAGSVGKVGFVFTGQGAQRVGMGRQLYAAYPVFAEAFDAVCVGLEEHLDHSVSAVIDGAECLDDTVWAQAGLFAIEVALFRLLESWGVAPAVVAGHSIGELAAAHVAGVWSLSDACAVVAARGRLMQALPSGGAMLAVAATEDEVRAALAEVEGVDVAAVNGPSAVVVSGPADVVSAVRERFEAENVRVRSLRVSHAFHSSLMEPMLAEFAKVTASVSYSAPRIPIVSTLTGRHVTDELTDPEYWVRQVREPVRFADAVTTLRESGVRTFIELGPDAILTALGATTDDATDEAWLPTLRRDRDEPTTLISALGHLHTRGGTVDWTSFYAGTNPKRVDLPTYAFTHQRYWLDAATGASDPSALGQSSTAHPLLGASTTFAAGGLMLTGRLSTRSHSWLGDHVVAGRVVVPGTALVEMAGRAGEETGQTRLAELVIEAPMILPPDGSGLRIQVAVDPADETGRSSVSIHSQPEATPAPSWTRHATGVLAPADDDDDVPELSPDFAEWPPAGAIEQDIDALYPALAESGLGYGPTFRAVRKGWRRGDEVFAEVALSESTTDVAGFGIHPALLDACLHLIGLPTDVGSDVSGPLVPFAWTDVVVHATHATALRVRLAPAAKGDGMSLTLADETGRTPVASVQAVALRPLPANGFGDTTPDADALYEVSWTPVRLDDHDHVHAHVQNAWVVLGHAPVDLLPNAAQYADVAELVAAVASGAPAPNVVVLPIHANDQLTEDAATTARTLAIAALASLQTWLAADSLADARLLVVTQRAVDAGAPTVPDPAAASVQGLLRVAIAENPGRLALADIDDTSGDVARLLAAGMSLGEPEFAVRQHELRIPRLARPTAALPLPPNSEAWRLDFTERGTLENLVLAPAEDERTSPLDPGQVRVGLRAAGVNFRDVLNVLGMYPGDAGQLGLEGAGTVLETGPDVTGLQPGDRVMGLFTAAFGPVAVTDARLLIPVPSGWSLTEAAAAPVVFLTAYYALVELAGLQQSDSILIHAAAGGVGIAAVQLARHLGADVFGTASVSKWPVLRELGLPDSHIASSRTIEFEETFRAATGGAGVDVVLDSLAGEFVDASLRLAAGPGGRFIEMGKTDVRDPESVAAEHDGLKYQAFDLLDTSPDLIAEMFAALGDLFARGALKPLPVACWDVRRAPDAFRYLSQARNVGKVVLTIPAARAVDSAGTVLITGASGALGGLVARHLADGRGPRAVHSLVLLSRRGPQAGPPAARLAADLANRGVTVHVQAADVADRDQLAATIARIPKSAPLRGVVHAAGLLDDGVISSLTPSRIESVLRPKMDGAWHLHELTARLDLDLFVLFSSIAGIWGNPGQGNYAAANTFLDALAARRRSEGLAALSLAWGPWQQQDGAGSGMTAALSRSDWERLSRSGTLPLTADEGLALLDAAGATGKPALVPVHLDPAALEASGNVAPLLSAVVRPTSRLKRRGKVDAVKQASGDGSGNALAERLIALDQPEQEAALLDLIGAQTALVLGLPGAESINARDTFKDLGIDSLTALELRNRLNGATGLRLPATLVFDYPTGPALAGHIRSELVGDVAAAVAAAVPQTSSRLASSEDDLVIVGMGCRFPGGVGSPAEFWQLLADGTDTVAGFPEDRGPQWTSVVDTDPDAAGKSYASEGAFLYGAGDFDAQFFGISPREALAMDPQQRLLLETSWEALEDAGIDPASLHGSATGVFAGLIYHDYGIGGAAPDEVEGYVSTGTSGGVASGRVSYALGLEGPAVTVDTACSSSLVALHLAVQSLRSGECGLALVGGVTVMSSPGTFVEFSRQRGLAADGRCKAFAEAADGTGWGEGVGVLVVERLSDARRNGHQVLAVVRGTAVNQDGASNGLTAPNGPSQQRVIRAALDAAGLQPGDVDVVEGHGTGTRLGDPIEAQALLATYGRDRDADRPVLLGSVKSNIGHTQAAAGVAGVIKMVQAMSRGVVPATLHVDEPSSHVDWQAGSVRLVTEATEWPQTDGPRRAGVSSFGFSGTNAHVILEQAPEIPAVPAEARSLPVVVPWLISARDEDALAAQAVRLREFVLARPDLDPVDVGWSLVSTRSAFSRRAVVVGADRGELLAGLNDVSASAGSVGKLVFVFTGQGAQRVGMGRGLYAAYPVFAEAFDAVCAGLEEHLDHSISAVIDGAESLDDTVWAQAGLFAIEVALFRLLESWGVAPAVVAGHSIGELAAAHVAGVWSLSDACSVVAARGRLMQALPPGGAMLAVAATEDEVRAALAEFEGVDVAAVNGPSAVVVSGPADVVSAVRERFEAGGVRVRSLRVSHAFHSSLMEPMLAEFAKVTASVSYSAPSIPIVSTLTGRQVTDELTDPGYWVRQVRESVRFADAVTTLRESGVRTFIELGPDAILTALGATTDDATDEAWLPTLRRDRDEPTTLISALGHLHTRGGTVDWTSFYAGTGAKRVDLPTYPFTHHRYWLTPGTNQLDAVGRGFESSDHPLLGAALDLSAGGGLVMTGRLSLSAQPWLADHVVAGQVVVPGAALVEMAVRAGDEAGCARLAELVIQTPLVLPPHDAVRIQITVAEPGPTGDRELTIHSRREAADAGAWTLHASGVLAADPADDHVASGLTEWPPADAIEEPDADLANLYPALAAAGLAYGPTFRAVRTAWRRGDTLFAEVGLTEGTDVTGFGLHPALLDASLHLLGTAYSADDAAGPLLPFAWTDVELHSTGATAARVRLAPAKVEASGGMSVTLADETGALIASIGSLVLRAMSPAAAPTDALAAEALYELDWIPAANHESEIDITNWAILGDALDLPDVPRYPDIKALAADQRTNASSAPSFVIVPCGFETSANTAETIRATTSDALATIQSWLASDDLAGSRLILLTTQAVDAGAAAVNLAAAGVWGLGRVAAAENPGRIVLVDLDERADPAQALTAALAAAEAQVAIRGGQVLVPRLARATAGLAPIPADDNETSAWRLECTGKGTLENLALIPDAAGTRELAAGEVRVGLRAAGVNFRDVLNVLGMYPGEAGLLGLEAAGVVLEVGADVQSLRPGDRVMGLFSGAFGPMGVADARLLAPIPAGWSMAEAAAAPVAYLTAWYALKVLAELSPGESVLIHAAAGGVGIAAVQVARHLGADVFGTASPSKWPVLRGLGLAESRIASSRTVDFEQAFRAATGGSGIDVVLDSLAGDFVDASLRLASGPGCRFVEMGKTDIREPQRVAAEHDGLAYQAFDLFDGDPDLLASMFTALSDLFARGICRPLPVTTWDVRRAPEAFRYLSQARNVGKVVLTIPVAPRSGGTVLVTGASGALGGLVARHLAADEAEASADSLVLLSRRGPAAPDTARLAAELAETGTNVRIVAADAADRAGLGAVLAAVDESSSPLRGVVHAAGVLDDAVIGSLTPDQIESVLRPKVDGAWNLHELTADLDLDKFVLFSSVAGVWGNPGQGNYAAANTVLDTLSAARRQAGLPAVSLAWGPWELDGPSTGMAGTLSTADRRRLSRQGFAPLTAADGLALLDLATGSHASGAGVGRALLVPARLDRAALRAQGVDGMPPVATGLIERPITTTPTRRVAGGGAGSTSRDDAAARLTALAPDEREAALRDLVVTQAALVLGLPGTGAMEVTRSFRELGFDSLTAVELRNRLGTATGLRLGAAAVFDHPTPEALAAHINRQLGSGTGGPASSTPAEDGDSVLQAFAGLEKVESALSAILGLKEDDAARTRVTSRVQELLAALRTADEDSVAERIDAADDDDIFDFIDRELGV